VNRPSRKRHTGRRQNCGRKADSRTSGERTQDRRSSSSRSRRNSRYHTHRRASGHERSPGTAFDQRGQSYPTELVEAFVVEVDMPESAHLVTPINVGTILGQDSE
jgi:hypothetical protein